MVCPRCRKKYPDGVEICPDRNTELVNVMGSADAETDGQLHKVVVENGQDGPTAIYMTVPKEETGGTSVMVYIILALGILLIAAGVFCFIKGSDYQAAQGFINSFAGLTQYFSIQ